MAGFRTETRLEAHRKAFQLAKGCAKLIRIEELSSAEMELVNGDFLNRCRRGVDGLDEIYSVYVQTLHSWGIMCPHPPPHRRYDGWHTTDSPVRFEDSRWYDCALCGAAVINR